MGRFNEHRRVTSADGTVLHAESHGPEGAPAVVLAHGWMLTSALWAAVVEQLADSHRVITYDLRGHGRSRPPRSSGYTTAAFADDLCAVLDAALAPGERAVVAGHSAGGMSIMAAARRTQLRERAAAVLLCSTGSSRLPTGGHAGPRPGRGPALRLWLRRRMMGAPLPMGPQTALSRRLFVRDSLGRAATDEQIRLCARLMHDCPARVRAGWGRWLAGLDLDGEVGELRLPVGVLVGSADRITPPRHARGLVAALPQCTGLTELPGVGHMTPVEAPDAVADGVRALVRAGSGA